MRKSWKIIEVGNGAVNGNNKHFDGRFNGRTEWNIAPGY